MLTRTQIIDAVCDIVGRRVYNERQNLYEGDLYHIDAVKWAAEIAFRTGRCNEQACNVLREALNIYDKDRLANFQNIKD